MPVSKARVIAVCRGMIKAEPRERRRGSGARTHSVTITDRAMIVVYDLWKDNTSHTDNPTDEDVLVLRKMLAEYTGQDLQIVSLSWLRNEMVALRKNKDARRRAGFV